MNMQVTWLCCLRPDCGRVNIVQSAGNDMGGSGYVRRFSVLGGSENLHENIILECLPSARNLDIHVQNVHSYPLKSVVEYHIGTKYENWPVSKFWIM